MEFLEDVLEKNPFKFFSEMEVEDHIDEIHTTDTDVIKMHKLLNEGKDEEAMDILDGWEDDASKAYWKRYKEARMEAKKAPDEIVDDFTKPEPVKPPALRPTSITSSLPIPKPPRR